MKTVKVKNIEIGTGIPKICIPITGENREEILRELEEIRRQKPDLAEWRVDCFREDEKRWEILKTISDNLGEIPLLFTFRTHREGGNREISFQDYVKLLKEASHTGLLDLIDVEVFFCEEQTKALIRELKREGVWVVASSHHFQNTPSEEKMEEIFRRMEELGGDLLKLAVMPENALDMLKLLEASVKAKEERARPVIAMSMGRTGILSRLCGEITGSSVAFAAGLRASAPGQIPMDKMRELLREIHEVQET